ESRAQPLRSRAARIGGGTGDTPRPLIPDVRIGDIMAVLSKKEIRERLMNMPEWSLVDSAIYRKFTFKSFLPAIAFVKGRRSRRTGQPPSGHHYQLQPGRHQPFDAQRVGSHGKGLPPGRSY